MSWARKKIPRQIDTWQNLKQRGYCHKLCPYSTEYKEKYKYEGEICVGVDADNKPIKQDGIWVMGNSTALTFYKASYATYESSIHTTTSGRMVYASNPPGWLCDDPNCYYHTTVASGHCYREV